MSFRLVRNLLNSMRNKRRKQVIDNRKKRRLVYTTFGVLLFIYLTHTLIAGESGLLKYIELRSKKEQLIAQTKVMKQQTEDIGNEINKLEKEPDMLEENAREYGLTKEGELIFKFDSKK